MQLSCCWPRACGSDAGTEAAAGQATATQTEDGETTDAGSEGGDTNSGTDYLGSYTLANEDTGTLVTVTVDGDTRTIESNALPDHETGEFPNEGNPNTISEQDLSWEFPLDAVYTGEVTPVRTSGVAVNGLKFEPGTAETVTCDSGEMYRIEAIQGVYDLGLDFNNAHVQPTGEYHYHGVSDLLVDAYDDDEDLVLVGFAADGHLMYYSKSGAYASSYVLSDAARAGTDCEVSFPGGGTLDLEGTTPDGAYTSDWVYTDGAGDLDQCNGATIDGEYAYVLTDAYPFISRCVMGEATGDGVGGGPPPDGGQAPGGDDESAAGQAQGAPPAGGQGQGPDPVGAQGQGADPVGAQAQGAPPAGAQGQGVDPVGAQGQRPDLAGAAEALGVTEQALMDALGGPPPDLESAAETLGVTVEELAALVPVPS